MAKKKKRVVVGRSENTGGQTGITSGHMSEFWRLAGLDHINGQVMDWILKNYSKIKEMAGIRWREDYVIKEQKSLKNFFGKEFDLSLFREALQKHGIEQVKLWKKHGFEIHFLPDMSMSEADDYPGWKVRPEDWYYNQIAAGKIFIQNSAGKLKTVKEARSPGRVVLIDTRLKPNYNANVFSGYFGWRCYC